MRNVVLAGACRTPIGTMGGALSSKSAVELGTLVISEALKRAGVPASEVDMVYMGCVIQAALGQNVARQCALKAGLPVETPAMTLNVVCGSGLAAVNMGAALIASGDADIVVAGGTESMSNAPFALPKARFGYRMNNGTLVDTMVNDALWDAFNDSTWASPPRMWPSAGASPGRSWTNSPQIPSKSAPGPWKPAGSGTRSCPSP